MDTLHMSLELFGQGIWEFRGAVCLDYGLDFKGRPEWDPSKAEGSEQGPLPPLTLLQSNVV